MQLTTRFGIALGLATLAVVGCNEATAPSSALAPSDAPSFATGNGALSGEHFTLNIIGVGKDKNANMDAASGHVIFVDLGSSGRKGGEPTTVTTKIMLTQGDFAVLDKNGTDGEAAFQLPAPAGGTAYQVYARALGTPGGQARITTCAEDVAGNGDVTDEVCSTQNKVFVRGGSTNQRVQKFENVTQELTTIVISEALEEAAYLACGGTDTDGNTGSIRVDLFNPCLENYFWKYDNTGLKVLQVRFYPTASN